MEIGSQRVIVKVTSNTLFYYGDFCTCELDRIFVLPYNANMKRTAQNSTSFTSAWSWYFYSRTEVSFMAPR